MHPHIGENRNSSVSKKMSSCPFFMSVGDHGNPYGARADFCSACSGPLVISISMQS